MHSEALCGAIIAISSTPALRDFRFIKKITAIPFHEIHNRAAVTGGILPSIKKKFFRVTLDALEGFSRRALASALA